MSAEGWGPVPKLPADLQDKLEQQAARDAAEAPMPVTVVLLGKEHEQFEREMAAAKEELGGNARRGQCPERVCLVFLDSRGRISRPRGTTVKRGRLLMRVGQPCTKDGT